MQAGIAKIFGFRHYAVQCSQQNTDGRAGGTGKLFKVGTLILQAHAKNNRAQLSTTGIC
jgi:hypothetical protein